MTCSISSSSSFTLVDRPDSAPADFFATQFDAGQWDAIPVPPAGGPKLAIPPSKVDRYAAYKDRPVVFGIRPEDTYDPEYAHPGIKKSLIDAKVDVTELLGHEVIVYLMTEHVGPFLGTFDPRTSARVGQTMQIAFDMSRMHLFDKTTEMAIR